MKIHVVNDLPILLHRHSGPFTNVSVRVRVGSAQEAVNQYGVAHALEHMMFKGTPTRNDMQIDRDFERLGATNNAGTDHHHTFYWVDSRNETWLQAAEILADLFLNPLIPVDEWIKEKDVILSEYRRGLDEPEQFFWNITFERVFGLSAHSIIGTGDSIKTLGRDDLAEYRRQWYGKPNVYVLAVGDVDENDPSALADLFGSVPAVECVAQKSTPSQPTVGMFCASRPALQEARVLAFQEAKGFGDPHWLHDSIATTMLGGTSSALLFERIRKELGLGCYGLYAQSYESPLFGMKLISAGIDPTQLDRMVDEIKQILNNFPTLINEDRFEIARAQMLTALARQEEKAAALAGALGHYYELGAANPWETRQAGTEQLKAMRYDEVREYANDVFKDREWYWARLLPE